MYACFDIGGTAIKTAAIDTDLTFNDYQIFDSKDDLDYLIGIMKQVVEIYQQKYQIKGICISMPGAVDVATGFIHGFSALSCIHGFSWKEKLKEITDLPVSIENDANCVALCEVQFGKAKNYQDILSLVVGTGIGGSVVKNGKIHHGSKLFGGEFGYMIFDQEKPYKIFSALASTSSLIRNVKDKIDDDSITGIDVFNMAMQGNEICQKAIDDFYHHLAIGVYNLKFSYDPEMIVFSGAVCQQIDFIQSITNHLEVILHDVMDRAFGMIVDVKPYIPLLEVSAFSKDANLYGALANFLKEYEL